jgi:hypothetical protein
MAIKNAQEATRWVTAAKFTSDTTAPNGRELYHLQFSLQAASPETFGYTLIWDITLGEIQNLFLCLCKDLKCQDRYFKSSIIYPSLLPTANTGGPFICKLSAV